MKSTPEFFVRPRLLLPASAIFLSGFVGVVGGLQPVIAQTAEESPSMGQDSRELITSTAAQVSKTARSIGTRAVGTITGEGTAGRIAKFTGPNQIGTSVIVESAGNIGIGTGVPSSKLTVSSAGATTIQGDNSSTVANAYGIQGRITSNTPGAGAAGLRGTNSGTNSNGSGVYGSHAGAGIGVNGSSITGRGVSGSSNSGPGVFGSSSNNIGLYGLTNATTPGMSGVLGILNSTNAGASSAGVRGENRGTNANGYGVYGSHAGGGRGVYGGSQSGIGVFGDGATGVHGSGKTGVSGTSLLGTGVEGSSALGNGVAGLGNSEFATGVYGLHDSTSGAPPGVLGETKSTDENAKGVLGILNSSTPGINAAGVSGINNGTNSGGYGVYGFHGGSGSGVMGKSDGGTGVYGSGGTGVYGNSNSGIGVYGQSSSGLAGYFQGNVTITGTLAKGAGTFKIDHPLDPAHKYLSHSFVESPDMMNIYNGNVTLDKKGQALVKMPDYFSALNREFRYQLTCIGGFAPVFVAQEIKSNQFKIAGGKPGMKVSWQVTGVRHDAYANANRVVAVEEKKGRERGAYLHPELFGQPKSKGIGYAHTPKPTKEKLGKLAQQVMEKVAQK